MFERLKSLPLTILLTILIWMYAEAQSSHAPRLEETSWTIRDVPVLVSGPQAVLEQYKVDFEPKFISVTVTGSSSSIGLLRDRLDKGGAAASGIRAYADISSQDREGSGRIRYVFPEGLSRSEAPDSFSYKLQERK